MQKRLGVSMGRSVALAIFLAILIIIGPIGLEKLSPVGNVNGQLTKTKVTLSVSPSTGYVDQTKEEGAAIFNGTITTQALPIVVITVNITINAGSWTNETSNPTLVITGTKDTTFRVKVYAPYNATANEEQDVSITVKWSTSLNEKGTASTSVMAVVEQFYGVNVYATSSYFSLNQGGFTSAKLIITNNGNGDDNIALKLVNTSILESMGCTFTISETSFSLEMDGQETVTLSITISKVAAPGVYKIIINATSKDSQDVGPTVSDDSAINIRIKDPGSGPGTNNTKKNETKPWCSIGFIPALVVIPLGASLVGVRTIKGRRSNSVEDDDTRSW